MNDEKKGTKNVGVKTENAKIKTEPRVKKESNNTEIKNEDEESEEYRWWEEEFDNSVKWTTLQHFGVWFPPDYVPHGKKLIYNGEQITLNNEAEEIASFYAQMLETDYAKNDVFNTNFFKEFRASIKDRALVRLYTMFHAQAEKIKDLKKCDFRLIADYFNDLKEKKKAMTKEDKDAAKQKKKEIDDHYGFAYIDGRKEKVGNFRVEPPGLFRGRGKHPKSGCLKKRIYPENVTINIGPNDKVPEPPSGHHWKDLVHNNTVTWLATWEDTVNHTPKYVFLAAGSSLKGQSDFKKFEKARELKGYVDTIRQRNAKELVTKDKEIRQRATALWLIDKLALRAGNEKGDDEADTVGCCSLRAEHLTLVEDNFVVFDFLGKDSIRYYNKVQVTDVIYDNLKSFMKGKKAGDSVFELLTTTSLNKYLTSLMPGLTAKVFRTYNASYTFQKELIDTPSEAAVSEKILAYNRANRQVAVLCNHQRSVPKSHDTSMEKLSEKILMAKYERYVVRQELIKMEDSSKKIKELEADVESDLDEDAVDRKRKEKEEMELIKEEKKREKEGKEPVDSSKPKNKKTKLESDDELPKKKKKPSLESLEKKLVALTNKIQTLKTTLIDRDENKTTALGTSKINYIDPRISVAWCNKHSVPLEKIFTKTLREKFKWAMSVDGEWEF